MRIDRHYEDEPSGCTATAALITDKNVLYVVCFIDRTVTLILRLMPGTHGQSLVGRVMLLHCQKIINLMKRVSSFLGVGL